MDLLPCCATKSPAPSGCMRRGAAGAEMAELVSVLVHLAHLPSVLCLAQPEDASGGALALAHHLPWYVSSLASGRQLGRSAELAIAYRRPRPFLRTPVYPSNADVYLVDCSARFDFRQAGARDADPPRPLEHDRFRPAGSRVSKRLAAMQVRRWPTPKTHAESLSVRSQHDRHGRPLQHPPSRWHARRSWHLQDHLLHERILYEARDPVVLPLCRGWFRFFLLVREHPPIVLPADDFESPPSDPLRSQVGGRALPVSPHPVRVSKSNPRLTLALCALSIPCLLSPYSYTTYRGS